MGNIDTTDAINNNMGFFLFATCLSAFLLFQVQPIIARFILPTFGGGPSVWSACLSFFQLSLLLGYLYAHLQVRYIPRKHQPLLHCGLLLASLALLPIGINEAAAETSSASPALTILVLLSVSIGIPFTLTSASAPLLQHWFAGVFPQRSPYRLYALSNLGSLLALISYPIAIEPQLTLASQANIWSLLYLLLIIAFVACGISYRKAATDIPESPPQTDQDGAISLLQRVLWVALAACGTTLLLAVTNQLTQNVAAVPFLWILPLSLYLISFIICFDRDRWYRRILWWPVTALAIALLLRSMLVEFSDSDAGFIYEGAVYCFALFTCCMVCHGELARRRSAVPHLTSFYLYIALGGALGGAFVNFAAPYFFTGFWELHVAIAGVAILAALCWWLDRSKNTGAGWMFAKLATWAFLISILTYTLVFETQRGRDDWIHVARSFFGVIYVDEQRVGSIGHRRHLFHGNIKHGMQLMVAHRQKLPTVYYGTNSGIGDAILRHPRRMHSDSSKRNLRIGAIGLGVGTIAALTTTDDTLRFYEIDPQVEQIAHQYFYYLRNAKADIEVVLGDARVTLQRELDASGSQQFDVLALDAFSGDSIPVHLLTLEAFDLYLDHLKDDGVLALHISSNYVDLQPVLRAASDHLGMAAVLLEDPTQRWYENANDWVLMSRDRNFIDSLSRSRHAKAWSDPRHSQTLRWTDDFSSLYKVIYWRGYPTDE